MRQNDWLWVGALLMLVAVGYGLLPAPEARAPIDSFSEDSAGKKAFFLLTQELLERVERSSGSLIPVDEAADVLVMLGPARYPDRAQWQTLHDWVARGRALVFAARHQDPAVALEPFGIRVVPATAALLEPTNPPLENEASGFVTDLGADFDTDLEVDWISAGEVRSEASDVSVTLSVDGSPQVMWRPIGDGVVVVVASDYIFTNRSLATEGHGLLAFRILESASPQGSVYFDEEMNEGGAPRVVGILFESPFRVVTIQFLVITLLFAWMAGRRFGPLLRAARSARRSLVEHAEALGSLHFKVGSGPKLIVVYLEFFRQDFGLRLSGREHHLELDKHALSPLPEDAKSAAAIDQAVRAARSPSLERGRVAHILRSLAEVRRKATMRSH